MSRSVPVAHDWSAPFRIEVEPERQFVRVVPVGELDVATAERLAEQLDDLRDAGWTRLVLDLRQLVFMDSSGLHLILRVDDQARTDGHDFSLIAGPPAVQRVFELVGICGHLRFRDPHGTAAR